MFLMALKTQVSSKDVGKNFCLKRCINWILVNEMRSGKGSTASCLNNGSVCELYDVPATILMAFFWSLKISFKGPDLEQDQICMA